MSPIDKLQIDKLKKKDTNPGKELNQNDLEGYFDETFFDDLEKGKCKIKEYGNLYIFEQIDKNSETIDDDGNYIKKFCVKKHILRKFLRQKQHKEETKLESSLLLTEFLTTINTKFKLSQLENDIESTDIENLKYDVDVLIGWFEKNRKRPRSAKPFDNINIKRRFKEIIRDDLSSLRSIKRELENYKNYKNIDILVNYVDKMDTHKDQLDEVRQIIVTGGSTENIPAMLDSIKDMKKEASFQKEMSEYNLEFSSMLKNATMLKLRNEDSSGFQKYLQGVWSGETQHATDEDFYIQHESDFLKIKEMDYTLYNDITHKKRKDKHKQKIVSVQNKYEKYKNKTCVTKQSVFDRGGEMFSDLLVKQGWIDHHDTAQKEAWKKFGKVGILLGTAVLGFKFFQNLFSKKKENEDKWMKTLLYGGGALTILNFDKLSNRTKNAFGLGGLNSTERIKKIKDKTGLTDNKEVASKVEPPIVAMEVLGNIPITTLLSDKIVSYKDKKLEINESNFKNYIDNNITDKSEKKRLIEGLTKIQDNGSLLSDGLALLGINNLNDMRKQANGDDTKTLLDSPKMGEHYENLTSDVNAKLAQEGFESTNAKNRYIITQEYKKNGINNQIILKWIDKGMIQLRGTPNYSIEDMKKNNKIDMNTKTMMGFEKDGGLIRFDTYKGLFNAVKLTGLIQKIFKNKSAVNKRPFHVSIAGNIEFNDKRRYELWTDDLNAVNSNMFKNTLVKLSPTLNSNRQEYVNYLNDWYMDNNPDISTPPDILDVVIPLDIAKKKIKDTLYLIDTTILPSININSSTEDIKKETQRILKDLKETTKNIAKNVGSKAKDLDKKFKDYTKDKIIKIRDEISRLGVSAGISISKKIKKELDKILQSIGNPNILPPAPITVINPAIQSSINTVSNLGLGSAEETALKDALIDFYEDNKANRNNVNLSISGSASNAVIIESHGIECEVNLNNLTFDGFEDSTGIEYVFRNYEDLLNSAAETNRIKSENIGSTYTKDRFEIIATDSAGNDVIVTSSGTLAGISLLTLSSHLDEYIIYLNK